MLPRQRGATLLGLTAVLMWSCLTGLSVGLVALPPFEVMTATFLIGGLSGMLLTALRGNMALLRAGWPAWGLGVGGIFADYGLFFAAIRLAPAAQASLLSYIWPLFAVLLSVLLLHDRWQMRHLLGAGLGMAALGLLAVDQGGFALSPDSWRGYGLALASAVVWAGYSTVSRRFSTVPSEATFGFCLGVSALAAATHFLTEPTIIPAGLDQWLRLIVIGIGPSGLAFAAWDRGMKRGDIRALSVVSYAIPVLSTLVLVVLHLATPTASLIAACVLIAIASTMASPRPSSQPVAT